MATVTLAKYTFDNTDGKSILPTLTPDTVEMTYTDTVDDNVTTREVFIDDSVEPTRILFASNKEILLTVEYLRINNAINTLVNLFNGCSHLSYVNTSNWDTSKVTSMNNMFNGCYALTNLNLSNFNTSETKHFEGMFQNCQSLTTLNLSSFNTEKATTISAMFRDCTLLESINVSSFNTSSLVYASRVFYNCTSLKVLDLTSFIATPSLDTEYMFTGMTSDQIVYTNANLWTLDTSSYNATFVSLAGRLIASYKYNSNLYADLVPTFTGLTTSQYTTKDVTANSTITVDTNTWVLGMLDTTTGAEIASASNYRSDYIEVLSSVRYQFNAQVYVCCYDADKKFISVLDNVYSGVVPSNCKYVRVYRGTKPGTFTLTTLNIKTRAIASDILPTMIRFGADSSISTREESLLEVLQVHGQLNTAHNMFFGCSNLTYINTLFNTSNVNTMVGMFRNCKSLKSLDVSNFNTEKVDNMASMFCDCSSLTVLDVSKWDVSQVKNMAQIFMNCSSLTTLDLSNFNTSQVTTMSHMFNMCSSLTTLDLSNFNTSQVTTMSYMFNGCSSLISLNVSGFNTNQVDNMLNMFTNCSSLTSLDLSNFDTNQVTNMSGMFTNCSSLTTLDLSNFDTNQVTTMSYMFNGCSSLISLDLSNFNTNQVDNMSYMFNGCSSLTSLDLSNFNTNQVTTMLNMFYKCSSLTSLDISNFDTGKVIEMSNMFNSCHGLKKLDISNFNMDNVTNTASMYNNSSQTEIGMIYCSASTINKFVSVFTGNYNRNIYYHDANLSELIAQDNITYQYYNKSSVTLPYELNKLPNGVADYIDVVNGVYVQRVGKAVFDGSNDERWTYFGSDDDGLARMVEENYKSSIGDTLVICDKFTSMQNWNTGGERCYFGGNGMAFFKNIGNYPTSAEYVSSWRAYLSSNSITVLYQLGTPIYTPLTDEEKATLQLSAYQGGSVYLNAEELKPSKFEFRPKSSNRLQLDMLETGHYYLNAPTGNVKLGNVDIDVTEMPCIVNVTNATNNRLVAYGIYDTDEVLMNIHAYIEALTGTVFNSDAGRCSDYVNIVSDTLYTYNTEPNVGIIFYDSSKKFISGVDRTTIIGSHKIQVPNGAIYYRLTTNISVLQDKQYVRIGRQPITLSKLPSHRIPTSFTQGMKSSVNFGYWEGIKEANCSVIAPRASSGTYGTQIVMPKHTDGFGIRLNRIEGYYSGTRVIVEDEFDVSTGKFTKRIGKYILDGSIDPYTLEFDSNYNMVRLVYTGDKTGISAKRQWNNDTYGLLVTETLKSDVTYSAKEPHIFLGGGNIHLYLSYATIGLVTKEGVREYFTNNPMTVYYELATPEITYYDLSANSLSTMSGATIIETWKNTGYLFVQCKPAPLSYPTTLSPNTQYTVFHNRKNYDSSVKTPMINLGGTEVSATGSRTVVTTPSTLAHNELQFIGGENTVEQVMVLHGDWTKEGKTVDYFEGLQSSVIGDKTLENLVDEPTTVWATVKDEETTYVSLDSDVISRYSKAKLPDVQSGNAIQTYGLTLRNLHPSDYTIAYSGDNEGQQRTVFFVQAIISVNEIKANQKYFIRLYDTSPKINRVYFNVGVQDTITFSNISNKYAIFTASSNFTAVRQIHFYAPIDDGVTLDDVKDTKVIVCEYVEGMENLDIPYFEGLKSVQAPTLTTTGKNLFDGQMELGSIVTRNGEPEPSDVCLRSVNFIKVRPSTTYIITNDLGYTTALYEYDSNFNYINNKTYNQAHTTLEQTAYIKIKTSASKVETDLNVKYQIEEGSISTTYEPYKSTVLSTPADFELNGVGTYRDVIGWNDGIVRRNCVKFTISGDEGYTWHNVQEADNTVSTQLYWSHLGLENKIVKPEYSAMICDKLPWEQGSKDNAHIRQSGNSTGDASLTLVLYLDKQKLSAYTPQGINDYIKSIGGLTIVAPLINTEYQDVSLTGGGNWNKVVLDGSQTYSKYDTEGRPYYGILISDVISVAKGGTAYAENFSAKPTNLNPYSVLPANGSDGLLCFSLSFQPNETREDMIEYLTNNPITVYYNTHSNTITNTDPLIFNHGTLYTESTIPTTFNNFALQTTNRYSIKDYDTLKYTVLTKQEFNFNATDYPASSTGMTIIDVTKVLDSSMYSDDPMITVVQDDGSYYADGVLQQFKGEQTFVKEFIKTSNGTYSTGMTLLEPLELCSLPNGVKDEYNPVTGEITDRVKTFISRSDQPWQEWDMRGYYIPGGYQVTDTTSTSYSICDKYPTYSNATACANSNVNSVAVNNKGVYVKTDEYKSLEEFLTSIEVNPFTIVYQAQTPQTIQVNPTSTYISTRPENGNIIAQDTQIQAEYLNYDNEQSIISPRMLGDGDEIRWEQGSQCYVYENDNEYIPLTEFDELFGANIQAQEYTQYAESVDGADIELGVALKEKAVYEQTYVKYEDNVIYPETMENLDETNGVEVDYICGATWQNPDDLSDIRHLGTLREDGQYDVTIRRSGDDEIRLFEGDTNLGLNYNVLPPSEFELTFFNNSGVEVGKYGDTSHMLEDCVQDGKLASGTVYGQTLNNIMIGGGQTFSYSKGNNAYKEFVTTSKPIIGKTYVYVYDIVQTGNSIRNTPYIFYTSGVQKYHYVTNNSNTTTGRKYWIITIEDEVSNIGYWININNSTDSTITIENCMFIEYYDGIEEYLENYKVPYFEGIQSTILSTYDSYTPHLITWKTGKYYDSSGNLVTENATSDHRYCEDYIEIAPNHTYKMVGKNTYKNLNFYDKDKQFLSKTTSTATFVDGDNISDIQLKAPSNAKYMRLNISVYSKTYTTDANVNVYDVNTGGLVAATTLIQHTTQPTFSSCGKNLFNMVEEGNKLKQIDDKIVIVDENTWDITASPNYWLSYEWKPVGGFKTNTSYTITMEAETFSDRGNLDNIIRIGYTNGTNNNLRAIGANKITTPSTKTIESIRIAYGVGGTPERIKNLSVVEGANDVYEPYKGVDYTLPTPIELRKVGDVCDTYDVVSGVHTQRIDVFESEVSSVSNPTLNNYGNERFVVYFKNTFPYTEAPIWNNHGFTYYDLTFNYGHDGSFMYNGTSSIYLTFAAGEHTAESLRQLFIDKPLIFFYETNKTTQHTLIPSTVQTTQEPTFILPQPLRSVPNGICDRLYWDENKGHYCIEKRIGHNTISSGDINDWSTTIHNGYTNYLSKGKILPDRLCLLASVSCGYGTNVKFMSYDDLAINNKGSESVKACLYSNTAYDILFKVKSDTATNITTFRQWWDENNPMIYYPLATPEIIDLPHLDKKVELPTQRELHPIGYKVVHEKVNPELGLTIPYKVLNMPTQPVNLNFEMDIADYVLTWDDVKEARQYNIILNDEVIATTKAPYWNSGEEMYGYILVEAQNEIGDNLSTELYIKTVPNAPAQLTVGHNPLTDHYDFEISFVDTSNIADYYTVMYKVDNGDWVINNIQNSELTTGEKHLWSFSVYEIKESIEVWATATNDVGTNDILPSAIYYMSPTPQWTYRINSKEVFLRWLDESPYDTRYKLRYSYKSNGVFQYAYFEGDTAEIGKLYESVVPLAEDDEVTLALCIISEKENLYCKPITASKTLDPNIVPPLNFNYHWLARGLIEFYWEDQYDVDVEYEYVLESMKSGETLWETITEVIPSRDVEGTGEVYRVEYQLEDLEQIRMRVRMKWAMNETEWTETLTTVFIPVEGNPPTYIRRTQTAEGLLIEWEAQAYIDSYHIYVIDNTTGEELQHLETQDNSILVNLDYSNSIEIAIYEISRFSGGIESDPTDSMVFTPTMAKVDIDQRIYQPCAETYPIEVSTVQKANKQAYVIHDISYTPNVETEHELGVSIATPFTMSYHPLAVDVHQAGTKEVNTINAHIKTLDTRNEDQIRIMTFERTSETYDMNFTVYTPSTASYAINLEVSKVRIVCLGDSLTSGHPFYWAETGTGMVEASYPYQLSRRLKNQYEVINSGYGSDTTDRCLARFDRDVLRYQPQYCIFQCGTNDLYWAMAESLNDQEALDMKMQVVRDNTMEVAKRCWDAGIIPIIGTLIPRTGATGIYKTALFEHNEWIISWCNEQAAAGRDIFYVDFFNAGKDVVPPTPLEDPNNPGAMNPIYDGDNVYDEWGNLEKQGRGIHLNPEGYAIMASAVPTTIFQTYDTGLKMYQDAQCTVEDAYDDSDAVNPFYTVSIDNVRRGKTKTVVRYVKNIGRTQVLFAMYTTDHYNCTIEFIGTDGSTGQFANGLLAPEMIAKVTMNIDVGNLDSSASFNMHLASREYSQS